MEYVVRDVIECEKIHTGDFIADIHNNVYLITEYQNNQFVMFCLLSLNTNHIVLYQAGEDFNSTLMCFNHSVREKIGNYRKVELSNSLEFVPQIR